VADSAKPQRAWRAACPNCGAPVEFRSAASASAVCGFCLSTLVRDGDALKRIGQMAELFDDHSPLQLGATGRLQGLTFTLVGRLQYSYAAGTWNEWHALFDNGRSAWLSDDNGAYVLAFDRPTPADAPPLEALRAGQRITTDGRAWDVASVTRAKLIAALGELPAAPALQREFTVVDLRNAQGEVGTLDDQRAPALQWSSGRSVLLADLALQGLRESSEKTLAARSIECPNCGTSLEVTLASTKSIACRQCAAVVDVSSGVGGELAHYVQNNADHTGAEPELALGATASLQLGAGGTLPWTVVGFMERCDLPNPGDDEEQTFWREYLLYNATAGFAFLVDAEDGWSWVRPLTGAPEMRANRARWQGEDYVERYRYAAKVTWVQGEFYWRVQRDERAHVIDYDGSGAARGKKLSREQTGNEVTWSGGQALDAHVLAAAFKLPQLAQSARADTSPLNIGSSSAGSSQFLIIVVIVFVLLVVLLSTCGDDDCDDVRQAYGAQSAEHQQCLRSSGSGHRGGGGGSYGGWSSGGGHK
jgi:ribosomal protein S27E